MIGRIADDPFVETVKNGKAKALFAQVQLSHNGEVHTAQLFPGTGAETWPCKDDVVIVERARGLLYAVATWDREEPTLKPGEREIYSRNANGDKKAFFHMDQDGNLVIKAKGKIIMEAEKTIDITAGGNITSEAGGNIIDKAKMILKN